MRSRTTRLLATVGAASTVLGLAIAGGIAPAQAAEADPNAYLKEYTADNPPITGLEGNTSGYDGNLCGFQWQAQSVLDSDFKTPSLAGFIQSVTPDGSGGPGSGFIQIQHWFDASGNNMNWRIPIALDTEVENAQVHMVFDDPDWEPNQGSFKQYNTWPDYPSAFNRFWPGAKKTYQPHDDASSTPYQWGTDANGHTTLTFGLGNIKAGTATVLQFNGTPTGTKTINDGTTYGAKLTLDGTQPKTNCLQPSYTPVDVTAGETATSTPQLLLEKTGAPAGTVAGTVYTLGADAPAGATIDPATGTVTLPVPADQAPGVISVPVTATYSDGSTDAVTADFNVTVLPKPTETAPVVTPTATPTPAPTASPAPSASPTPAAVPALAHTGADMTAPVIAGIAVLAAGLGLLGFARRRNKQS